MLGPEVYDAVIIFVACMFGSLYLGRVYPPAQIPFILLFYALWLRFTWKKKDQKLKQLDEYEELLKQCKKPVDRWGRES